MKVIVFAGPTGGHFYPALAFVETFQGQNPGAQILFVTGERGRPLAKKAESRIRGEFVFLPDFPFPRTRRADFFIRIVTFLLKLLQAFLRSRKILTSFQPHLAVGFGSYIAFPGLLESRRRKIPTLIHEQNRTMGKANAWLVRFADRLALSFEDTLFPPRPRPWKVTGLPLRSALIEAALQKNHTRPPSHPPGRVRILVLGGSQGSQFLNQLWMKAIGSFSHEEKQKIAVIHLTGEGSSESVKAMYLAIDVEARVLPFYEQMEELYSQADLAITRAGAGTLFELALFGLPAVVLPYPHAEGHQELNARYFEEGGGIFLFRENACTAAKLQEKVSELIHSPDLRNHLSQNLKRLARPDASEKLVGVATELLKEREKCLV